MEDWDEEIFAEGVGVKWKNERVISSAPPHSRHCTNPLPVKHLITIRDGGIESLINLAFRSKITPALQATVRLTLHFIDLFLCFVLVQKSRIILILPKEGEYFSYGS